MISDIIIIFLIVFFAFLGYRRGLARTLLNFAAMLASSMLASFVSDGLAQLIYDAFFKQSVISSIQNTINTKGVETAVNTSVRCAPDWVQSILGGFMKTLGMSLDDVQRSLTITNDQSLTVAQNLEKPVGELTVGVISIVLTGIVFVLLFMLFKLLIRKIIRVFDIPVVGLVNHLLGTVTGLAEGLVFVVFAVNIIYVVVAGASPGALNSNAFGPVFNALCFFK
ncbi:MAG TPA: hypothetical protein DEO32_05830 [Ruminococcaceae bacterium]|nr:hypothetical protein [Oscillospiraceae bacterium]